MANVSKYYLDEGLVSELRRVVCETQLYRYDAKVKSEYSMICAVADRIQDAYMTIVCLDMEGVLVPEIWIAFADKVGIPDFKRMTRR